MPCFVRTAPQFLKQCKYQEFRTSKSPLIRKSFSGAEYRGRIISMIPGYAPVSTDGRLMLTVLGGLAEFERDLICTHQRRQGGRRRERC
jgi:DNA invertase Pin-like site-specific DNA recombinase